MKNPQDSQDDGIIRCNKGHWKNCPTVWKGQFRVRKKFVGIILEAVGDHNQWFWLAAGSFPGTLYDINICEQSSLYKSMVHGDHDELDFDFVIDGEVFSKLIYLLMVFVHN
jgi:hypothetical protein